MKNMMKKVIMTILSAVLFLTVVPMVYAEESNNYKVGDIIQFGSYPQSAVYDEDLIYKLDNLAPVISQWISYGYFSGTSSNTSLTDYDTAIKGDWMRYVDIECEGVLYRGVYISKYRPYQTHLGNSNSYQYDVFNTGKIYWFKFEPLSWMVLNPESGLLLSKKSIDSQPYTNYMIYYNKCYYINSMKDIYASNYEYSYIRSWLNQNFYDTAFNENEKNYIKESKLNNKALNTSYSSKETIDNVFLLSYNDINNYEITPTNEITDYSFAQGINGNGSWLLRTAGYSSASCCYVNRYNQVKTNMVVNNSSLGIRPALVLDLTCKHCYESKITLPTCTEQGYTTYTCTCGDSYIDDYIDPEHTWSEWSTNAYNQEIRNCLLCEEKEVIGEVIVGEVTGLTANSNCTSICLDWVDVIGATHYDIYGKSSNSEKYIKYATVVGSDYIINDIRKGEYSFKIRAGAEIGFEDYSGEYSRIDVYVSGHKYDKVITNPTCTKQGYTTYSCSCGDSYIESIDAYGHNYNSVVIEPTCTEKGFTTYTCTCGDSYKVDYVAAKGHSYTSSTTKNPTCTEAGVKTFTCSCNDSYTESIPAIGHKDDNGDYKCDNGCGYEYEKPAPEDPEEKPCDCDCHKGGIAGFFFKLINFFVKIFDKNARVCDCGKAH